MNEIPLPLLRERKKPAARRPVLLFGLGLALLGPGSGLAGEIDLGKLPPAATQNGVTYDKDIRPLFEQNCFKCHGPEKQKGKLRLDSLAAALKGGEDGKVIEKGNSAKSLIVRFTARLNEEEGMPPKDKGNPLTKEQVGLLRAWIDQGAK
jgi:mono/diheme cytochrome c family protein